MRSSLHCHIIQSSNSSNNTIRSKTITKEPSPLAQTSKANMRSALIIPAALAALAAANPLPQDIDWDAVDALSPIPTVTIPVVDAAAQETVISYTATAAASTVSAAIAASGISALDDGTVSKRDTTSDTDASFAANPTFSSVAVTAPTPSGYVQQFSNLNASNNAYGYMGYTVLSSYDVDGCANQCNAIDGCASINIYYERDPSTDPTDANPNPSSITNIKCVFWGGPVTTSNAVNYGEWRKTFHVVIAGSNGYMNSTVAPVTGYAEPTYLGNAAINAPLDCNGDNTYMGVKIWSEGPFDPRKCAAACSAASVYDTAVGIPSKANPQTCQFYNTYLLLKNNTAVGQYCALYNQTWASSYATNQGQWRGSNHYTIAHSYAYSNSTNPGTPVCN